MDSISEFNGDASLKRDKTGSWINYVAVVSVTIHYL